MLDKSWYMEPAIDFELKKYTLLAFLQKTEFAFNSKKIEPFYSRLKEMHKELSAFHEQKQLFEEMLPKNISALDIDNMKIVYEKYPIQPQDYINEISKIVYYSTKQIKQHINHADNIIREINYGLQIFPLGIQPLYKDEGYLFLLNNNIYVFQYSLKRVYRDNSADMYYVNTDYIGEYTYSFSNTLESIKIDIQKQQNIFDLPATYVVENQKSHLPVWETLLPLAKNILINYMYMD